MFEAKATMFMYCVSPLHMGAGTALGAIDSPIQRERHTGHPMMAGSGIKGALRHEAKSTLVDPKNAESRKLLKAIYGPDVKDDAASEHAGAVSFSDGQLVLFPVRSTRQSFVYATCPTALARLERLLALAGTATRWKIPAPARDQAMLTDKELVDGDKLILEAYAFQRVESPELAAIAGWLSEQALPKNAGMEYFRDKVKRHTVVLNDDRFAFFVKNATVVEPHVRIEDETGTASDGGLFYVETLPPESVLVSLAMSSKSRSSEIARSAREILSDVRKTFDQKLVQMGGDATTGRGQVLVRFCGAEG